MHSLKSNMELIDLIKEYNETMAAKRMMGKVCLAYGLSESTDSKRAWKSYNELLAKCTELRNQIEEFEES